jgi:hypothetical protein
MKKIIFFILTLCLFASCEQESEKDKVIEIQWLESKNFKIIDFKINVITYDKYGEWVQTQNIYKSNGDDYNIILSAPINSKYVVLYYNITTSENNIKGYVNDCFTFNEEGISNIILSYNVNFTNVHPQL